jgi:hypothetical protein
MSARTRPLYLAPCERELVAYLRSGSELLGRSCRNGDVIVTVGPRGDPVRARDLPIAIPLSMARDTGCICGP